MNGRTGREHGRGLGGRRRDPHDHDGDVVPRLVRGRGPQDGITDVVGRGDVAPLLEAGPELVDRVGKDRPRPFHQAVGVEDQQRAGREQAFALCPAVFTGRADDA